VATASAALSSASGPVVINYRVNAGRLPASHWYKDRIEGGRLLGEVCHFVDTCSALVGAELLNAAAVSDRRGEVALAEELAVILSYADGSVAAITYATGGHSSVPKEQIEIHRGGHTVVIDDFKRVSIDGQPDKGDFDKGHMLQLQAFARQLGEESTEATHAAIATTRTMLRLVGSLVEGQR
jgi:predicted dehydrogenase